MKPKSPVQPNLLGRINERQVLRTLLLHGSCSRADLTRITGMAAPTVSKAVESLITAGLLEENEPTGGFGRPAKRLSLASRNAQVIGFVIDKDRCRMVSASLDGTIQPELTREFATPENYDTLIELAVSNAQVLINRPDFRTEGIGISVPGLVDYRNKRGVFSPNVPITNGKSPAADLQARLNVPCVLAQEEHALCLAERLCGSAKGMNDFAMLDVSTGVGLGVMNSGRPLLGHSGLAGEIGHITVDLHGRKCGCSNTGCLETVACDSALAYQVSARLQQPVTIDNIIEMYRSGELTIDAELKQLKEYLAVALAAVINLYNPAMLCVYGRMFELDPGLFDAVVARAQERALKPSAADCTVVLARGSKRQGAVAVIVEHMVDAVVPEEARESGAGLQDMPGGGPGGGSL